MNFFRGLKASIPISIVLWLLIIWACLYAGSCAHAGDWSTETKIEEALYQSLHVIDASQTVYIARHPDQYYEKESGWLIGAHPSESRAIQYMALDAVGHAALTATLVSLNAPRWMTRTWELLTIADTANCVRGNFKIGIRAQF
jgi:hypothetical protein